MNAAFLLGRVLFGGFFLQSGINHLAKHKQLEGYVRSKGIPYPDQSVIASGAVLAAGGASLILGVKPKLGAAGIIGFLAIASATMHDFWNSTDPGEKQNNIIQFSKNAALLGAAVALMGIKQPWPISLEKYWD